MKKINASGAVWTSGWKVRRGSVQLKARSGFSTVARHLRESENKSPAAKVTVRLKIVLSWMEVVSNGWV